MASNQAGVAAGLSNEVERAVRGDNEAFGLLYERYADSLFRMLLRGCKGSVPDAEDAATEVWLKAKASITDFTFTHDSSFIGWLYQIGRNHLRDMGRTHYRTTRAALRAANMVSAVDMHDAPCDRATAPSDPAIILCDAAESALDRQAIQCALNQLRPAQRQVVLLRFWQGLSIADTANVMGKTQDAVKQLQFRAMSELVTHLPDSTVRRFSTGATNVTVEGPRNVEAQAN